VVIYAGTFALGELSLIKIMVVRFLKHYGSTLAPFVEIVPDCTLLLHVGAPYAAREAYLRATAQDRVELAQERDWTVSEFYLSAFLSEPHYWNWRI